jgi:hypothetical protein
MTASSAPGEEQPESLTAERRRRLPFRDLSLGVSYGATQSHHGDPTQSVTEST